MLEVGFGGCHDPTASAASYCSASQVGLSSHFPVTMKHPGTPVLNYWGILDMCGRSGGCVDKPHPKLPPTGHRSHG